MRPMPLLLLLTGCVTTEPAPPLTGAVSGEGRPGLQTMVLTKQVDNQPWKIADERGNVVLLDVWATWCEPCEESLPMYHDLLKQFGPRGLKVYGINVDADSKLAKPFLEKLKLDVPILLDPGAAVAESALQVKVMPTAFIVDKKGNLRHVHEGFAEDFLQKYVSEIEALLAEK